MTDSNEEATLLLDQVDKPLTSTERTLISIWGEVLQSSTLPKANDDFFDLGGDSMTMVMTEFRIAEEFLVELPPGSILTARTVRELSSLIDQVSGSSRAAEDA